MKCCHLHNWNEFFVSESNGLQRIWSDLRTSGLLQKTKNIASCTKQQEFEFHECVFLSTTSQNIFNATEMPFAFRAYKDQCSELFICHHATHRKYIQIFIDRHDDVSVYVCVGECRQQ